MPFIYEHALVAIFYEANMSLNIYCENKILAKICEFTIHQNLTS